MKIIQAVLTLLLCLYVAHDWNAGNASFTVVPGLDVSFWFAIPLAAICALGSVMDLAFRRSRN